MIKQLKIQLFFDVSGILYGIFLKILFEYDRLKSENVKGEY